DAAHSEANFKVRHLMSNVSGSFNDFAANLSIDQKNPAASSVEFTIQAASIDTDNENRDKHLRSSDWFEVEKYPTITFKSTKVEPAGKDKFNVTGNLTMRGVTKAVTLPVTFLGYGKDPWGNDRAGFEAETTLDRKDYGLTWNKTLDTGGVLLGDEVKISLNLEFVKAKK
ncbi:MAG TPA: YceI family protein, partial [Thermoanaerobaculia bacterium]|nr:YceI family protein [Thermoanaerobaculia bacterium]